MLTVLSVVILGVAVVAGLAGGAVGYAMARRSDLPLRVARLERELNVRGETGGRTAESRPTASPGDAGARTRSADSAAASTGAAPGAATAAPGGSSRAADAGHETTTGNAPAQPPTGVAGAGWWQWLSERIRRGNTPAQVGTVLLLVGVGLLVRLAAGSGYLPVAVRLAGAAAGGLVLLVLGWWLRHRYRDYALIIQGAGLGVIYLTAFAAVQLYAAVAAVPAFFALVVFTAATVVMAVAQNAFWLATFALAGGFLAPLIAASGGGSHILLFSYYLVLNAGILGVAWSRAWRSLNLLGFAFTVVLGGLWGAQRYEPGLFASVEPFLIAHVVLYCAVAILFALRQPPHLRGLVDGTLVFGTPVVGLALQASMVAHIPYGLAVSAAAAGGFYVLMASAIWRYCGRTVGQLTAAFAAIGLVCATLAIPLAVNGRWTAAAWALESGGIIWVALRQQRRLMLLFGLALQVLAGLAFLNDLPATVGSVPLLNHVFMGCVLIAGVGIATGWQLHHRWPFRIPAAPVATAFMLWATAWWLGGAALQIEIHLPDRLHVNAGLAVAVGTAVVATLAAARLSWPTLQWLGAALLPALGLVTLAEILPKLDAGGGALRQSSPG